VNIEDKRIVMPIKTAVVTLIFLTVLIASSVMSYMSLVQRTDVSLENKISLQENKKVLDRMQCDIRQLKNYMVYGIKPTQMDKCE